MSMVSRCRMLCPLWLVSLFFCSLFPYPNLVVLPLVMRTHSNELTQGGTAFPSSDGHILGPRAPYMSAEYSPGSGSRTSGVGSYFGSAPFAELGESPDAALRRIAAQRRDSVRDSMRESEGISEGSAYSGVFGSLKRGLSRFRN